MDETYLTQKGDPTDPENFAHILDLITVKPHLVATSVMRPPHYSGQVQQVQMYFPLCYIYLIFVNRATSL